MLASRVVFLSENYSCLFQLDRMFIGEKISMLDNTNAGVPRLGVPNLPFSECLHGVLVGCGQAVDGSTVCLST